MNIRFFVLPLLISISFLSCREEQAEQQDQAQQDQQQEQPQQEKADVPELYPAWSTDTLFRTPESAFFHPESSFIYVSNVNGEPLEKDGNGFISRLDADGKIQQLQWVTGLDAPKGIGVSGNILYVTDIDKLVEIDLQNGTILRKHNIPGAQFLNDVVVAADSAVYFSDTNTNKIHSLKDRQASVWLDQGLNGPNGLKIQDDSLYVAMMNSGEFKAFSLESKEGRVVAQGIGAGDGVVAVESEDAFLVSNWNGEIWMIQDDGQTHKVLDTKDKNINAADIGFIQDRNLVLVPTFNDNRLMTYELKK